MNYQLTKAIFGKQVIAIVNFTISQLIVLPNSIFPYVLEVPTSLTAVKDTV